MYGDVWREIVFRRVANVYNIIHKPKLIFTTVSNDLCVTFEDSHPCASIHIKIQSNLTTRKTILQMPTPKPE